MDMIARSDGMQMLPVVNRLGKWTAFMYCSTIKVYLTFQSSKTSQINFPHICRQVEMWYYLSLELGNHHTTMAQPSNTSTC